MQNKDRLSTRIDNNNDGNDDSNYDTCIPSETHPESRSKFYYHDNQDSRQLLELMREHSGKKQAGGTKRWADTQGLVWVEKRVLLFIMSQRKKSCKTI